MQPALLIHTTQQSYLLARFSSSGTELLFQNVDDELPLTSVLQSGVTIGAQCRLAQAARHVELSTCMLKKKHVWPPGRKRKSLTVCSAMIYCERLCSLWEARSALTSACTENAVHGSHDVGGIAATMCWASHGDGLHAANRRSGRPVGLVGIAAYDEADGLRSQPAC